MTLPRMQAFSKRWNVIPPLSVSVANIAVALGMKPKESPQDPGSNLQEAVDMMGSAGMASGKPDWLIAAEAAEAAKEAQHGG